MKCAESAMDIVEEKGKSGEEDMKRTFIQSDADSTRRIISRYEYPTRASS
tara:strand:- start:95 stop:244 length:150 start_codon:yes stop_codon:yes gene_type:complete